MLPDYPQRRLPERPAHLATDRFIEAYRAADFRVVGHFVFPKRYTSTRKYVDYQHECARLLAKGYPKQPADTIGDVIGWSYTGSDNHWNENIR